MPLYHFTDSKNIASIRDFGLLSWPALEQSGLPHARVSNDLSRELDQRFNREHYVRLCLKKYHPMAYAAEKAGRDLVWLEISDEVMDLADTLYSDDNAASTRAIVDDNPDTAFDSDSSQAEILVFHSIPVNLIRFP